MAKKTLDPVMTNKTEQVSHTRDRFKTKSTTLSHLKTTIIVVVLLTWISMFDTSHGLIYKNCDNLGNMSIEKGSSGNKQLRFAVILTATETNSKTKQCTDYHKYTAPVVSAIQWVVDRLNTPHDNETFIPGYEIDFTIFDDCNQSDIATSHVSDVLRQVNPKLVSECQHDGKINSPYIAILSISNYSITSAILDATKYFPIPVICPVVSQVSLKSHQNFVTFAPPVRTQIKVLIDLLHQLRWFYTGIIYSDNDYGREMAKLIMDKGKNTKICFTIVKNEINIKKMEEKLISIINKAKDASFGMVYIGKGLTTEQNRMYQLKKVQWIILDIFGEHSNNNVQGSLLISAPKTSIKEVETYFDDRKKTNNLNKSIDTWLENLATQTKISLSDMFNQEKRNEIIAVIDSVYAMVAAKREDCRLNVDSCFGYLNPAFINSLNNSILDFDTDTLSSFFPKEYIEQKRVIRTASNTQIIETNSSSVLHIYNFWNGQYTKVGEYNNKNSLQLSRNLINMKNTADKPVSGNELPISMCSQSCPECESPQSSFSYIHGDILLLGIFSSHDSAGNFKCGQFRNFTSDAVASEAFLYAVNRSKYIANGIKLGALVIDDCYSSLRTITNISSLFSDEKVIRDPNTNRAISPNKVVGVIGPLSSGVSKTVADFFTYRKTLVVSYGASSVDLDDHVSYPYFIRTVPSDVKQVNAIISILKHFKWNYVGFIYANNNYGAKAKEVFLHAANKSNMCVSKPTAIAESPGTAPNNLNEFDEILTYYRSEQVKIIVYFGTSSRFVELLDSITKNYMQNHFTFIGSETWGLTPNVLNRGNLVAGSLTLTLDNFKSADSNVDNNFRNHLKKRFEKDFQLVSNPNFNDFWYSFHECTPPKSFVENNDKTCTGNERFSDTEASHFANDQRVVHTMNAVYGVYEAIKKFQSEECTNKGPVPCENFFSKIDKFISNVKDVMLQSYHDKFKLFGSDGNGLGGFKIHSIQESNNVYIYKTVGAYRSSGLLDLTNEDIHFYNSKGKRIPELTVECPDNLECCKSTVEAATQTSIKITEIVIIVLVAIVVVILSIILGCYVKNKYKKNNDDVYLHPKIKPVTRTQERQVSFLEPQPVSSLPRPNMFTQRSVIGEENQSVVYSMPMEQINNLSPASNSTSGSPKFAFSNNGFILDEPPQAQSASSNGTYEEVFTQISPNDVPEGNQVPLPRQMSEKLPMTSYVRVGDTANRTLSLREENDCQVEMVKF